MSVDNRFSSVERVELLPKGKKRRAGGKGKRALLSPKEGKFSTETSTLWKSSCAQTVEK